MPSDLEPAHGRSINWEAVRPRHRLFPLLVSWLGLRSSAGWGGGLLGPGSKSAAGGGSRPMTETRHAAFP
jgi:hypothetical protein